MYRLTLYFLIALALVGAFYTVIGVLPFNLIDYVFLFTFVLFISWLTNLIFSKVFEVPANVESFWISGLILALIVSPPKNIQQMIFVFWAAVLTMALKFILAVNRKHVFNPVAISVAITAFAINGSASWWVGTVSMLPVVLIGGFLIVRKIKRWDLVLSFLAAAFITTRLGNWGRSITDTALMFFATIMLTEPLTTPPTRILRIIYGAGIGLTYYIWTPEIALIIGNIFSYIVSPKYKLILKLKEKIQLTSDTLDFVFELPKPIKFTPGQYMEFTLDHPHPDDRGNRRYLSLASSPSEKELRIGVKIGNPPSSYKRKLLSLEPGSIIAAGQLIGDFTLPKDLQKKLVFIAGGIGITPFRSMLKFLVDENQKRNIVVIYLVKNKDEFVYTNVLSEAQNRLGVKTVYVDSETQGRIGMEKIVEEVPDYKERTFYLSGSRAVVDAFDKNLKDLKIPNSQIITDYFPGFA